MPDASSILDTPGSIGSGESSVDSIDVTLGLRLEIRRTSIIQTSVQSSGLGVQTLDIRINNGISQQDSIELRLLAVERVQSRDNIGYQDSNLSEDSSGIVLSDRSESTTVGVGSGNQ
jgi:hypothetical protein